MAEKGDEVIGGHVGSYVGKTAVYLLGATSPNGYKSGAAYLLQWYAIKYAKQSNCDYYDLGGIDAKTNKGVYHFKKGLGGMEVIVPGPYESGNKMEICFVKKIEMLLTIIRSILK